MKKLSDFILLFVLISCDTQNNKQIVGDEILFRDIKELKGFSIYEETGAAAIDEFYGISSCSSKKNNNTKLIVFEKIHRLDDKVKYSIVDTLLIENIPKNNYVGYCECRLYGKIDQEIIVLYEYEDDVEFYTKIRRAWRADRKLKKIFEIDTNGIDYINEGYGV